MSAAEAVEHADHGATILAELEAVATVRHRPEDEHPAPVDAADVQAMDVEQRRAWLASTTGPQRWEVVGRPGQPDPPPRPRYAEDAACQGTDADLSELTVQRHAEDHVMAACARCPVLAWCAADARDHAAWGLWAGVVLANGRPSRARHVPLTDDTPDPAEWLTDQLGQGPRRRAELLRAGRLVGIGPTRLDNAANILGIERVSGQGWAMPQLDEPSEQSHSPQGPRRRAGQRRQPRRLTRARRRKCRR